MIKHVTAKAGLSNTVVVIAIQAVPVYHKTKLMKTAAIKIRKNVNSNSSCAEIRLRKFKILQDCLEYQVYECWIRTDMWHMFALPYLSYIILDSFNL